MITWSRLLAGGIRDPPVGGHDMPWNVREIHGRHPDGHVFRISRECEEAEQTEPRKKGGRGDNGFTQRKEETEKELRKTKYFFTVVFSLLLGFSV